MSLPARIIPVPQSISPQAQAFLSAAAQRLAADAGLAGEAGDRVRAGAQAALNFLRPLTARFKGELQTLPLPGGASLYRVTPQHREGLLAQRAYFDIHGGGFIAGGGEMCRLLAMLRAMDYGVEVFAVDYRLMPAHAYPAALDDCLAAYHEVLRHYPATQLVAGGSSAGGNLLAALCLRARDEGLPLPAGLLLLTPAVDLSGQGDSHQTNRYLDVNLYGGAPEIAAYAGSERLDHPHVSPLFGRFGADWPPTLLASGTRDLLLSDTVRLHRALRRAGVRAELHVTEAAPHGGFMGAFAPEDQELMAECKRFARAAWGLPDSP